MKNIAILAGGYSGESVISLQSARTVYNNLDRNQFTPYIIRIEPDAWTLEHDGNQFPINKENFSVELEGSALTFDGAFMAIHGTPGEDGKLQGYFDMLGIPYNCCDVMIASLTFNKGMTNQFLGSYGISTARRVVLMHNDPVNQESILDTVGLPCFVKPNCSGSSLGISKVNESHQLESAIAAAFKEDSEVVIESFIEGTEITCGCHRAADGSVEAIAVTEIVAENEFFDYEAKYHDKGTQEITPARIDQKHYDQCMKVTEKLYGILRCRGMIRADYILQGDQLFVIEVNTVPGLSPASLIPQMVEYRNWSLTDFFTNSVNRMFVD